jgi:hypothetical protein
MARPATPYDSYKELSRVTHVSETILRREVDLEHLNDQVRTTTSYAVYVIMDMREQPQGGWRIEDEKDFQGWTIQDFNKLPRAIRRELLLALIEHGYYSIPANRTQAEKLWDIANGRSTMGQQRKRKKTHRD